MDCRDSGTMCASRAPSLKSNPRLCFRRHHPLGSRTFFSHLANQRANLRGISRTFTTVLVTL